MAEIYSATYILSILPHAGPTCKGSETRHQKEYCVLLGNGLTFSALLEISITFSASVIASSSFSTKKVLTTGFIHRRPSGPIRSILTINQNFIFTSHLGPIYLLRIYLVLPYHDYFLLVKC
jgi:hypothetical protein